MERQASNSNRYQKLFRADAIAKAESYFDSGCFFRDLTRRVAISTKSGASGARLAALRYLHHEIAGQLHAMGFTTQIVNNQLAPDCPFLIGERIQGASLPTVLIYAHGDVAMEAYGNGKKALLTIDRNDRWYGPGVADNKAQHSVNLAALEHVICARNGDLGYNVKVLFEMGEEQGSPGLLEICQQYKEQLKADFLIASDGSRMEMDTPSLVLGSWGYSSCHLVLEDSHSSGYEAGLKRLDKALAQSVEKLRWRENDGPKNARHAAAALKANRICTHVASRCADEPTAFKVKVEYSSSLANGMDKVVAVLRDDLERSGFHRIRTEPLSIATVYPALTRPDNVWVEMVARSLSSNEEGRLHILPYFDCVTPSDIFQSALGLPTLWIPHAPPSCAAHSMNEHVSPSLLRNGLALMAGLLWDIGGCAMANRPVGTAFLHIQGRGRGAEWKSRSGDYS